MRLAGEFHYDYLDKNKKSVDSFDEKLFTNRDPKLAHRYVFVSQKMYHISIINIKVY